MMADLISRAAAIDAIVSGTIFETAEDLRKCAEKPGTCNSETWIGGANDAIHAIEDMEAVDAVPVVHGRWIQYDPDLHGTEPLECSVCNYLFGRIYPRNYCPNCGAKMDGEVKA